VPRQNSTGGKTRLGGISKRGGSYLRRLLVNGAHATLLRSKAAKADPWLIALRARRPRLFVAVALANKTARIAWAIMTKKDSCRFAAAAEPQACEGNEACWQSRPAGGSRKTCSVSWDYDPGKLIRPQSAEPIGASGPSATAFIGRAHDRTRPSRTQKNPCKPGAIHT
jgi:hypothetical protein